jgi:hypothetical protein
MRIKHQHQDKSQSLAGTLEITSPLKLIGIHTQTLSKTKPYITDNPTPATRYTLLRLLQ